MDVASAALQAVSRDSASAPALAFAAGLAGSIGPCAAPRLIAITGLGVDKSWQQSAMGAGSFVAGLVSAYVLFAVTGSLIWGAFKHSTEIYLAGAALMAVAGLAAVIKSPECQHTRTSRRSSGGLFFLGASSALMVSPCCTPVLLASIAYAGITGLWFSCAVIACFALGHAFPLGVIALGGSSLKSIVSNRDVYGATKMIAGSLLLALAGYYAVMA